jgi:ribosomal protein S18 acetylase RimI-like enzyme
VSREAVDRVESFRWGTALLTPSLPQVWDLNLLRVERLPRTAPGRRIAAAADELLTGLDHRKVTCDDAELGVRLAPELAALGWDPEVLLVMAWPGGDPPSPAGGPPVREGSHAELADTYHAMLAGAHGDARAVVDQLLDESARVRSAQRLFVCADGRPASLCRVYMQDATAEIDDVGSLPQFRRRGLASALTLGAVRFARAAGCHLIFLRADASDRPRDLYARLGFRIIGRHYSWVVRRPPAKSLASRA